MRELFGPLPSLKLYDRPRLERGQCAQPCRYQYALMEEKRPGEYFPVFEDEKGTYIMNSRDMCMIDHLDDIMDAGIDCIKIEGRAKSAYYAAIVDAVIRTDRGGALVEALCLLIQRLAIERLHIVGDIYDRGPYPHIIMDALMEHHSLDIQWGNHDIVWMGASLGQRGCIAHVVRNCARYGNLSILEDAYGINILPLASFALEAYKDDPCVAFGLKGNPDLPPQELSNVKIPEGLAIIQFKVEAQLIDENPGLRPGGSQAARQDRLRRTAR